MKRAGEWQSTQRKAYKKKELAEERIRILNETPGWTWEEEVFTYQDQVDHWNAMYVKSGNKKPSRHSKDPEVKRAGQWQDRQRHAYKKKELAEDRILILNETPGWTWEDTYQDQLDHWNAMYVKSGNKKPSRTSKDPEVKRAGKWQANQRHAYKNNKLTEERIRILNETPGWTWEG